ncbi:MAG: acyl-CoA thioesterase [Fimbriimonas sp.]
MDPRHEFAIELVVHSDDIDELDHVNNAVYLQYVEQVARAHSDSLGFTVEYFLSADAVPVVRRHEVIYHLPAHDGDNLRVHTRVKSMKGVRAVRHTTITREGVPIVDAETEWVWVEPKRMRPIRIPENVRAAFVAAETP